MSSVNEVKPEDMTFCEMIERLKVLSKPVINDRRQQKYCEYITRLLSHFGGERCLLAGSTQENMRLRIREDEGDFDYLLISEKTIPSECLEYRDNNPCFVHIRGLSLRDKFPDVELIEGRYLPSALLSEVRTEAFKHLGDIYRIVCKLGSRKGRHTLHVLLDRRIKPGRSLINYANAECREFEIPYERTKKDPGQIIKEIQKRLENEPLTVRAKAVTTLSTVTDLTYKLKQLLCDNTDPESNILQAYGPVIDALEKNNDVLQNLKRTRNTGNSKLSQQQQELDGNSFPHELIENDTVINNQLEAMEEKWVHPVFNRKIKEYSVIKYTHKTSKDFIPAFSLYGKPKYFDLWRYRKRVSKWPPSDTIEKIWSSEIFIVAKPALVSSDKCRDFCLGFNKAELELAEVMTGVQKKVLLIVKALRKNQLQEYSDLVTSFHWKTAIYWKSETVHSSVISVDTEENVLIFLRNVLGHMIDCLRDQNLPHYFMLSNLFAGLDAEIALDIASKILEIQSDPLGSLRIFFVTHACHQYKQELVPRSKILQFNKSYNDPSESSKVEDIFRLVRRFISEDAKKFKEALRDVLTEAMPFIIEEEMRGRKKTKTTSLVEFLLSFSFVRNVLVNSLVLYIGIDQRYVLKKLFLFVIVFIIFVLLKMTF